ncbi:MBL fold metallo-hydrolase [Saccharomonospora xinjiangensis]|uniref:MBL fold metallo-hydrolase n=1 Tax=Saccharomonospora xinjiangensis TaxID=75294 RepID=UPI0010702BD2|nr:MBL fold metallo-hydrolase [Saccharomonospora xinjiangensis]
MEIIEVMPRLHLLRFEVGQCYIWQDADGATLVDAGPQGHGDDIADALDSIVGSRSALHTVVLTHSHGDHTGSLAEIRRLTGATVLAHPLEADCVRGLRAPSPPVLQDWERPLFEAVGGHLAGPPAEVDAMVEHGDVLRGGLRVVHVPGHTEGSIAVYEPEEKVLFAGDTLASHEGTMILGVFNLDLARLAESARSLSEMDVEVACFGHGDPVVGGAAQELRKLVARG